MAITSLVITAAALDATPLIDLLKKQAGIVEVQKTPDPQRLVALLEVPAQAIKSHIKTIHDLDEVFSADIAYINYEDDVENSGDSGEKTC